MKSKEEILFYNADFTACLTDNAREAVFRAMNEYAKGKCIQQRILCHESYMQVSETKQDEEDAILNAKEPEF